MSLTKKPVTGMKDILPREMQIRDYVTGLVKETYGGFGFQSIETPCVEHLENLCSKQGGENEKLIFKIMKRGEKLNLETAKCDEDVSDSGLRYDLTLPLSRYYANHANELPSPFKALQMGNVWRAERPQKGRFRQFMQCDIDILGEGTNLAEIELILATTTLLSKLDFKNFRVKINERRILKAMTAYAGFDEDKTDNVFVILDKMDKIGIDGVREELLKAEFTEESVDKYLKLFDGINGNAEPLKYLIDVLGDDATETITSLQEIIDAVEASKTAEFKMVFDPTLVRGMGYYTGTIFEIAMPQLGAACGGGGRYDKMVGRFTGQDVPACGFSIGFERIILILTESGFKIPGAPKKVCIMIDKKYPQEKLPEVMKKAAELREEGNAVLVVRMNKNKKFQKDQLMASGYENFIEYFAD